MKKSRAAGPMISVQSPHLTVRALRFSILTAAGLALLKFWIGLATNSMAILSSALDSLLDVGASTVNFIAAREAAKPPDDDHTYGHGKIESLASLFQSTLIGISGLFLIFESLRRLVRGTHVESIPFGILVMIFSMAASTVLVWQLSRAHKITGSAILATEKLHFSTDILMHGGVILALALVNMTGWAVWDLVISILVSFYIFRSCYRLLRRSIDELLDHSLPSVATIEIEKLILEHDPSIVGIHNFRSRLVGKQIFMDFHIEIRGEDDFKKAHLKTESLIRAIQKRYPNADVTVHYDPEGAD